MQSIELNANGKSLSKSYTAAQASTVRLQCDRRDPDPAFRNPADTQHPELHETTPAVHCEVDGISRITVSEAF